MVGRPQRREPGDTDTDKVEGADSTIDVPAYEHYNDAPRGSLPIVGNLPDSWGSVSTMILNKYRTTVITLTTRLQKDVLALCPRYFGVFLQVL